MTYLDPPRWNVLLMTAGVLSSSPDPVGFASVYSHVGTLLIRRLESESSKVSEILLVEVLAEDFLFLLPPKPSLFLFLDALLDLSTAASAIMQIWSSARIELWSYNYQIDVKNLHCRFDDNQHYLGVYIDLAWQNSANWKEPDAIVKLGPMGL